MNPVVLFPAYLPIFIVILIAISNSREQANRRIRRMNRKRKKENLILNNELIKEYIGKKCTIVCSGGLGYNVSGVILSVADNWLQIEVKDKVKTLNLDYILSIEEMSEKKAKKSAQV